MECGLLIPSIGYKNVVLDGVPTDINGRIDLIDSMRVRTCNDALVYASGWCAHLPKGVIANTLVCFIIIIFFENGHSMAIIFSLTHPLFFFLSREIFLINFSYFFSPCFIQVFLRNFLIF